jgi:crotonobetainyl-CoA:carnitine CoA-transferase CaiB-like acyl-CoA transferase
MNARAAGDGDLPTSGMMALTGEPDGPAVQPEIPLADYTAGMMALSLA